MIRLQIPAFVLLALLTPLASAATAPASRPTPADLSTIRRRYLNALLPPPGPESDHLRASAAKLTPDLTPDHSWPDIDYKDQARSLWLLQKHMERTLLLAKAASLSRRDNLPEDVKQFSSAANDALSYWISHDPKNPNWWWNEIGTPQLLGEIALALGPDIRPQNLQGVLAIMKRSVWSKWTGQNLVWGTGNQIVRGLLTSDPELVSQAYARMYDEIVITTKEGIQPDYSFHQHGAQFYSGGYGLGFANDVGRYIAYASGTPCEPPPDKIDIFNHFMLDGQAWMTWGPLFDFSALGREITRKGKVAVPADWSGSPIVPVGRAYGLGQTAYLLSQLPIPRQSEYAAFSRRLLSATPSMPLQSDQLNGHKHFYRSDYTAHRRPDYLFTLKMFSTRLLNSELVNNEGRKSHHLGDGNTFLYRTGLEYKDIFAVWDWTRLPGTTAELPPQGDLEKTLPHGYHEIGKTSFVGGVSDGTYGLSAMLLQRGSLSAKKSWFCFDHEIVCLGSDIHCDSPNPVVTPVEQCFLDGPVTAGPNNRWVHHAGIGYLFPSPQDVSYTAAPQTGRWSDTGTGSATPETRDVFSLTIDHGTRPDASSYAYVLIPGLSADQTAASVQHPRIEILSQSSTAHAVRHPQLHITMIAFFKPGSVANITVDHPCLLLLTPTSLTASNPENQPLTLHVTVDDKPYTLDLPPGDTAGSSRSVPLQK